VVFFGGIVMPRDINQYIFGNSLVNFAGGSAESNIPFYVNMPTGPSQHPNGVFATLTAFGMRIRKTLPMYLLIRF